MNYYAARELKSADGGATGLYHYTVMNDGHVRPVGYCSPWEQCPDCKDAGFATVEQRNCRTCSGSGLVKRANPCRGHPTPEGAAEHFKQYLLDQAEFRGPKSQQWPKHKCEVDGCEQEATHLGFIPGRMFDHEFCAAHANRDELSKLIGAIGEIASSY